MNQPVFQAASRSPGGEAAITQRRWMAVVAPPRGAVEPLTSALSRVRRRTPRLPDEQDDDLAAPTVCRRKRLGKVAAQSTPRRSQARRSRTGGCDAAG